MMYMKIAVLDKCTVTNGDVDLSAIESLGEVEYFDLVNECDMENILKDKDAVILNKAVVSGELMNKCPRLKYIGLFATGYNNIDIKTAKEKGIVVANVPGYSTDSVAQSAFAMILSFACNTAKYNESVHNGDWVRNKKFTYFCYPISELSGKTLGIFGFGNIGRAVAKIALGFNMNVIAHNRSKKEFDGVTFVDFDTLLRQSDYLSLHSPLNDETYQKFDMSAFKKMKRSAVLINTSRGAVVNEQDLSDALNGDIIAGAGVDALVNEPMTEGHPFLTTKNMIITPHNAWASIESRIRLIKLVVDNLSAFQNGNPINNVAK